MPYVLVHRVTEADNKLRTGEPFLGLQPKSQFDVDLYAADKELYLGYKCEVDDTPNPWQFWMIMLKNGNMDTYAGKCPKNGHKVGPFRPDYKAFPCFGHGCMNQPSIYHDYTKLQWPDVTTLKGRFFGSWDLDGDLSRGMVGNISYYSVTWEKKIGEGSWVFHHVLRTSAKYPWLMLYLRSDATHGFSGGYHYSTRGMSKIVSYPFPYFYVHICTIEAVPHMKFYDFAFLYISIIFRPNLAIPLNLTRFSSVGFQAKMFSPFRSFPGK